MGIFIFEEFGGTIKKEAARLEKGARASELMASVMTEIAVDMMKAEKVLFSSGGRRGGGQWKKLKDDTIRRKGHATILVRTGELRASLTEWEAPGQILDIGEQHVQFGTDNPLAKIHDEGAPSVGIPSRPLFKFRGYDYERWRRMIEAHLVKGFNV